MPDPAAPTHSPRPVARTVALALIVAVVYAITGRLGLALAHGHSSATLVWPPSGIALAAVLLGGPQVAPGVFLGAAVCNVWNGTPLGASLGFAVGNTLEPLLGAFLLGRAGFDPRLARVRDVLALGSLGALVGPVVAAVGAVTTLAVAGLFAGHSPTEVGIVWWLGDAAGVLVLSPLLLSAVRGEPHWRALATPELVLSALLAVATALVAFAAPVPEWLSLLAALAGCPIVVAAGLLGGPRAAVLVGTVACVPALLATQLGVGPFADPHPVGGPALVVAYIVALSTTAHLLAAAIRERDEAAAARARTLEENARLAQVLARSARLEAVGLIAGGVAHDFNNLLAIVRTSAATAKAELPAGSPARVALDEITAASARATDVCGQLLGVANRAPMTPVRVDLRAIAEEAVGLQRTHAPSGVSVRLEPGPPVPILGERGRLAQLVLNLVRNSIEALEGREGRVTVRIEPDARDAPGPDWIGELGPGPHVALEVVDDGPGMDAQTRSRLFEPLFTTKSGGHGLGGAVILAALGAHHGAIGVESAPERGTRCRVLLPRGELPPQVEGAPLADHRGALLVADDEPLLRRAVARALEEVGWEVTEASDGADALARYESGPAYVAVVLDVRMPRLSGPAALEKMRARTPDLPAVLLTGFATDGELGPAGTPVIEKPFEVEQLVAALDAEIGRARARLAPV